MRSTSEYAAPPEPEVRMVDVDACGVMKGEKYCALPRGHDEKKHRAGDGTEWPRKRGRQKVKRGVRVSVPIQTRKVTGVARSAGG